MNAFNEKLEKRHREGNPIRIGLIGAGQMGTEIITQVGEMCGITVAAVIDLSEELAAKGYSYSKASHDVAVVSDVSEANRAIADGKAVAATDYRIATRCGEIDAVVDATGSTSMGAVIALDAINHAKHIIMMNVECDVTIGPILRRTARSAGVVYSLAAGDEPAAIVELYRFASALGFEIIAAGKGKNNPLNIYSTPDTEREKADARKMSARMLCEFVDGSKTAVEMASVSNATGLIPDVRGMHAAKATVEDLKHVFIPKADGGILESRGVVDFAIGVHPGVFVIAYTDNARIMDGMAQRDMGEGPYYTLYRPFHLCSVEVPLSVVQAVDYGESSGHPKEFLTSECLAVAKKELKAGEILDGIGEYSYRGSIDHASIARSERLLPLGLAKGCKLVREVEKDAVISMDDISVMDDNVLWDMRRLQDKTCLPDS